MYPGITAEGFARVSQWPIGPDAEPLIASVRAGLHIDAPVNFRRHPRQMAPLIGCDLVEPAPVVDQVFVAGMDAGTADARELLRVHHGAAHSLMCSLLDAAYRATYAAATLRRTQTLWLTLIGGGVFRNPLPLVAAAMARAHRRCLASLGPRKTTLKRVVISLFRVNAAVDDFVEAFAAVGVTCKVTCMDSAPEPEGGGR